MWFHHFVMDSAYVCIWKILYFFWLFYDIRQFLFSKLEMAIQKYEISILYYASKGNVIFFSIHKSFLQFEAKFPPTITCAGKADKTIWRALSKAILSHSRDSGASQKAAHQQHTYDEREEEQQYLRLRDADLRLCVV